jgi:hypothetical protein
MPTLQATLKEVAGLGPGYLISDHGAYWLAGDLLERLEREAPERLTYPVSWVMHDATEEGAIYASDDTEKVLSPVPLYRVHRLSSTLQPFDSPDLWERHP